MAKNYYYKPNLDTLLDTMGSSQRMELQNLITDPKFARKGRKVADEQVYKDLNQTIDKMSRVYDFIERNAKDKNAYDNPKVNEAKQLIMDFNKTMEQSGGLASQGQDLATTPLFTDMDSLYAGNTEPAQNMYAAFAKRGPTRPKKMLGRYALSIPFGLATGGAGWMLPAAIGATSGALMAKSADRPILEGILAGGGMGVGGANLGNLMGTYGTTPSASTATSALDEVFAQPDYGVSMGEGIAGTEAATGVAPSTHIADILSKISQSSSQGISQGGSQMGLLDTLMEVPKFYDDYGLSSGDIPGGSDLFFNIEDYLGGGGGPNLLSKDQYGEFDLGGFDINEIMSDISGSEGGGGLWDLLKEKGTDFVKDQGKKLLEDLIGGDGQPPGGGQPGTQNQNWLQQLLKTISGGGEDTSWLKDLFNIGTTAWSGYEAGEEAERQRDWLTEMYAPQRAYQQEQLGLFQDVFSPMTKQLGGELGDMFSPEASEAYWAKGRGKIEDYYGDIEQKATERFAGAGTLGQGPSQEYFGETLPGMKAKSMEDLVVDQVLMDYGMKQQGISNMLSFLGKTPPASTFSASKQPYTSTSINWGELLQQPDTISI
jgi:hypothetical protein